MENKKNKKIDIEMNTENQLNFLNSILESSTEYSIIAINLNGIVIAWNAGAKRIYGYNENEMIGKNIAILHDPRDANSGMIDFILDQVKKSGKWSGEIRRVRKDDSQFDAQVTITLLKDKNAKAIGFTIISRDLTDSQEVIQIYNQLKRSQEMLYTKNAQLEMVTKQTKEDARLKTEFIANVSHELRTPLNAIIGFAELMYDGVVDPSSYRYREFLGHILSSARQLLSLINEMLDMEKIEAGKMEFHVDLIDFEKLMASVVDIFSNQIAKKSINFEIKIDPTLTNIQVDYDKLKQVMYNYVSNALKFTEVGGSISVHIHSYDAKHFIVEIEDSGIGISKEDIPKLFSPFQQIDSAASKKYGGSGLGLALVKRIVEAQGGKVGVHSIVGHGSTFYAILPKTLTAVKHFKEE